MFNGEVLSGVNTLMLALILAFFKHIEQSALLVACLTAGLPALPAPNGAAVPLQQGSSTNPPASTASRPAIRQQYTLLV